MPHDSSDSPSLQSLLERPLDELFDDLSHATDPSLRQRLFDEVVTRSIPLADRLATRFRHRGIALDDLQQVARAALVQAAQRFTGTDERAFLSYAIPCIRGELKRHFRDAGWTVRPPRRIQEARLAISRVHGTLATVLGREPDNDDLAEHTGLDSDVVKVARGVGHCYQPHSLDAPVGDDATSATRGETISIADERFDQVELRAVLDPMLGQLTARDRTLIHFRYFDGLTQAETGQRLGISQMQVSRVEKSILAFLREELRDEPDLAI